MTSSCVGTDCDKMTDNISTIENNYVISEWVKWQDLENTECWRKIHKSKGNKNERKMRALFNQILMKWQTVQRDSVPCVCRRIHDRKRKWKKKRVVIADCDKVTNSISDKWMGKCMG